MATDDWIGRRLSPLNDWPGCHPRNKTSLQVTTFGCISYVIELTEKGNEIEQ